MNSEHSITTLLTIALPAAISVVVAEGKFDLWDSVVGTILLVALKATRVQVQAADSPWWRLSYSMVTALCIVLTIGILIPSITNPEAWLCTLAAQAKEQALSVLVWGLAAFAVWLSLRRSRRAA